MAAVNEPPCIPVKRDGESVVSPCIVCCHTKVICTYEMKRVISDCLIDFSLVNFVLDTMASDFCFLCRIGVIVDVTCIEKWH